ncbi:Uroporphyrinogen-III synthase [Bacillus velezensis]|nr:Uroporphyrinogen-III synthase [Bacillus velezensis]
MANDLPLQGKTVLVTRNKRQAAPFRKKVEALGGTAVSASLIAFQEALPDECADSLREDLSEPGWLVFTSVNGVRFFFPILIGTVLRFRDGKKSQPSVKRLRAP